MNCSSKTYNRLLLSTFFFITISCNGPEKLDLTNIENEVITFYDDPIDEIKNLSNAKLIYRAHNIEHKIWEDLSKGESNPLKKR